MVINSSLMILAGGLPYFILLEKSGKFSSKAIFGISATLLFLATLLSLFVDNAHLTPLVLISLGSALYAFYCALKSTNFYKLGYYLIFVNAPFFILFEQNGALYSISLLISLFGLYLIGSFYERNYESANYHYIRGITLATPYIGTYMTIYLISIALYPPFPNALFFLDYILQSQSNILWYFVVISIFFANFTLAMRVVRESLFGKPNSNIHYVELNKKEIFTHTAVVAILLLLSLYGLRELLL